MIPIDPVPKTFVLSTQVETIEVRIMTSTVPPGSFESRSTISLRPVIIFFVLGAELCARLWQTLTELPVNTTVDYPEVVELSANDEIVGCHLGCVSIPVLQLYQQLLGLG